MNREDGVLDQVLLGGTEIRFHRFARGVVRRIPWHRDAGGEWYSGIEGPEMDVAVLRTCLDGGDS